MNATAAPDVTCGAIIGLEGLDRSTLHRFIVGSDTAPQLMSAADIAEQLGDPFATLLLARGRFPRSGRAVLAELAQATAEGDPLRSSLFFVLGEGSQIPWSQATNDVARAIRFVVSCGSRSEGPDIILSVFDPDAGDVELMAWDDTHGGFNFFRTVGATQAWVWAGNSRHALADPTQRKGPFESHASGNLLMKELRAPWVNWHSPDANVFETAFAPNDPRRSHAWFTDRQGADVCEAAVAEPSIRRWARARFDAVTAAGGTFTDPARVLEQVLGTPTVNLISSHTESGAAAAGGAPVDLPQTFFVNSRALHEQLGLQAPPSFSVASSAYAANLAAFAFVLRDGNGFEQPSDTHFAFVVPERALEDDAVLAEALRAGLLTERLAASLLMVDFPNPIWSRRREQLLQHVPAPATVTGGRSSFSDELAERIVRAAASAAPDSPEREFADLWAAGEGGWRAAFDAKLSAYYAAVTQRLATPGGYDDYVRLAESRRNRLRELPIFEFHLLLPETNVPPRKLRMVADGTVVPA